MVVVRLVAAVMGVVSAASLNIAWPVKTEPTVATLPAALRLPLKVTFRVASASVSVPTGIEIGTRLPSSTLNCSFTAKPSTLAPDCETRSLFGLRRKLPARVKCCVPATSMMKKPSPSIAMSVVTPVPPIGPLLKFRWVLATVTPRPICAGLVPPEVVPGAEPSEKVRLKLGANAMRVDLYAVVFTFEMLLPMTSRRRELATRPERPVKSEVVLAMSNSSCEAVCQALARRALAGLSEESDSSCCAIPRGGSARGPTGSVA